ncbi:MAG: hypothetical protein PHR83_07615 [Paludibacter sp.]|nr:hypothetical protein [Paludibacter sp.]
MKKTIQLIAIIIFVSGLFGTGLLLYVNKFFVDFKSQTFNEVITPIATIFAAIIYLYTLFEIRRQSNISNNNFQFSFFKEKIEKEKLKLANWKLRNQPIGVLKEFSELIIESNGLKYYQLYNAIYFKIIESKEYQSDFENGVVITQSDNREYVRLIHSLFSINFQLYLNNCSIEQLLKEINGTKLSDFQKKSLNELIIIELLNDYMLIFQDYHTLSKSRKKIHEKWIEFSYNEILYRTDIAVPESIVDKEFELCSSLKEAQFDRLSNYISTNKLWK